MGWVAASLQHSRKKILDKILKVIFPTVDDFDLVLILRCMEIFN